MSQDALNITLEGNMTSTSKNTAIARKKPSAPLVFLEKHNMLSGTILDYGCGRGMDEKYLLSKGFDVDSYDPNWNPVSINRVYDTILCTYVLNVVDKKIESSVINAVMSLLKDGGKAYFSVRRDIKKEGLTSRGFQRNVLLDEKVIKEYRGNYCIYELTKN